MEKVLDTLNFQMRKNKKNVILFLDYAPECNFKEYNFTFAAASYWNHSKFLNKVLKEVNALRYCTYEWWFICLRNCKDIDILQAIIWLTDARNEVNVETIKNCFAKCGFTEQTIEDEDDIVDEEFNASFNKLADSECDMTGEEYVDFNIKTCSSLPTINSVIVDWKLSSVKASVIKYLRKECCDLNEVASDNDDGKDDDDDDDGDANSKAVEIAEIGTREALTIG